MRSLSCTKTAILPVCCFHEVSLNLHSINKELVFFKEFPRIFWSVIIRYPVFLRKDAAENICNPITPQLSPSGNTFLCHAISCAYGVGELALGRGELGGRKQLWQPPQQRLGGRSQPSATRADTATTEAIFVAFKQGVLGSISPPPIPSTVSCCYWS